MGNQNELKGVLERLREAEQLLMMGVERGKLSPIERDLVLEKLRKVYENLLFENKLNASEPAKENVTQHAEKRIEVEAKPEPILPKPEPEVKPLPTQPKKQVKEPKLEEKALIPEIKEVEKEIEIEIENIVEVEQVDAPPAEVEVPVIEAADIETIEHEKSKPATGVLGEKFQGKRKFRNESLSTGKKDMATKLQNKPIGDLTKSIGINDKFMFTKELFNGNAELYARTINRLNEFSDMNDALFFIQENFSWDAKNEAANQLIELVRRKLIPGY